VTNLRHVDATKCDLSYTGYLGILYGSEQFCTGEKHFSISYYHSFKKDFYSLN